MTRGLAQAWSHATGQLDQLIGGRRSIAELDDEALVERAGNGGDGSATVFVRHVGTEKGEKCPASRQIATEPERTRWRR